MGFDFCEEPRPQGRGVLETLVDRLCQRAKRHPEKVVYRFLKDGRREEDQLTYGELDHRARAWGKRLEALGAVGERALLLYPPGLDFIVAFLGCLYCGAIAVPTHLPRPRRRDSRLEAILEDARPAFVLSSRSLAKRATLFAEHYPRLAGAHWLMSEDLDLGVPPGAIADEWWPSTVGSSAEATAFLQYTSGSTSSPRGVEVSHANLAHNETMIEEAFGQDETSVVVGWLPPQHDMGLIGLLLQPLWVGATCVQMSPAAFLRRPLSWLEAIDRYRATTSGGPDFAYELCVRKISPEEGGKLDLSSWKVAFSGAEPVRAATLERFSEAFAPSGFRRAAFYPCYGLAEATLLVSGGEVEAPPVVRHVDAEILRRGRAAPPDETITARAVVGCGRPRKGQKVVVVDPETRKLCTSGRVGEIWAAGPNVARGYFGRPEATAAVFGARLANGGQEAFLRTGDLGFFEGSELFITGRLKDLIILRGRNHYPQDLELTAERSHPALRPGGGAAFTVEEDGEERLVLAHEVARDSASESEEIVRAMILAVAEEHEVTVHAVQLLPPGRLPKTSSGKVRRRACRDDFLAGRLEKVASWESSAVESAPLEPTEPGSRWEEALATLWGEVFERRRVSVDENFFAMGGDSLRAMQLLARIESRFGVVLTAEDLFEAPTVALLASRLEALEDAPVETPPVARRLIDHVAGETRSAPLSFAQRRLWFLHQLDPTNPVHNIAAALELEGPLNAPVLERALAEILRRHGALRTRFAVDNKEPSQVVEEVRLACPRIDLGSLAEEMRRSQSQRLTTFLARRPFDLERPFPWRSTLIRLGSRRHELILVFHHIVADGGSLEIFLRELRTLYDAFHQRLPSPLPELGPQYADFARWQRQTFDDARLAKDLEWWRRQLAEPPPATELLPDRPRPPVLSHRGAHLERRLPAALIDELGRLAESSGATLFTALLAGFVALLHRLTGSRDLLVGTPVAGRSRMELLGIFGVLINNLVLRLQADGTASFATLLAGARKTLLEAQAHQDVPFEKLVEALQPDARDLSRTPLFQLLFVGQNAPLGSGETRGLTLRSREIDLGTARFDLAVSVAPLSTDLEGARAGAWLGTWKYSTDLFEGTTIERLARNFENVLAAAVRRPNRALRELPLPSAAERHQALSEWNDTRWSFALSPENAELPGLLARRAERAGATIALVCGAERLTYRQLDRRANALAWRLRERGIGLESRVGIFLERSTEMVIALLGTLKAGAAYLPLDPDDPPERLRFMARDAQVGVVLTEARLEERLSRLEASFSRFDLTDLEGEGAEAPPQTRTRPDNAAYVIYTSGSTGRPKGVVVSHGAIVNRLLWMQRAYSLDLSDRVLQKTPYTFDVSVWEFFWPLLFGARLVVAPPGAHRDGRRLAELVRDHGITTLHFVPSMLRAFLEVADLEELCATVERVVTSGEALTVELRQRALERLPGELHNLYGPTEAAVDVTFHPCVSARPRQVVPIGRPISNLQLHVLDARLRPLPIGAAGKLHIGGAGLARGYFRRPALTAERFLPDSLGGEAGVRLYDTGDLARYRADGELEFLGRSDHQVKIRGFRIELGEIEAALARHPAVRQAAVVVRERATTPRLVAWLAATEATTAVPTAQEWRDFLRPFLPEHMIPTAFVFLDEWPQTSSGKLDRKALHGRELPAASEPSGQRAEPRNPLERRLAALFGEALEIDAVGVHDDFFALGGDSIRGAMLINRLQKELGEIIYVMALFDAPTPAELAVHLEQRYGTAVARRFGGERAGGRGVDAVSRQPLEDGLAALRRAVAQRQGRGEEGIAGRGSGSPQRNPPAVFLLSPFRSGSTLLRVMLDGHSDLFAPPELELLGFADLASRRDAYSGRDSFAREGLLRAVMELRGASSEDARDMVERLEAEAMPTQRFYRRLQDWLGDRLLIDKTPSYSLDRTTLERAEDLFESPRYIHLVRHPLATLHSYVEARMDQVYGFPGSPFEQAELVWLLAHRNIVEHLASVPEERQVRVRFEDLVRAPREVMQRLSGFLGLEMEEAMLEPYAGRRMTDGLSAESRMMGDPKFHRYRKIEAGIADRWRTADVDWRLDPVSIELARSLGYAFEATGPSLALGPVRRERRDEAPLSFAQERLWFLDQLDPGSPVYNMPAAVHLEGRLEVAALARSFAGLRERHEVLRTCFPERGGEPVQRRMETVPPSLPRVDLSALEPEARDAESHRQALLESRRSFDLRRGSMLRTLLLRLAEDGHLLLVTMHHIVSDGWSIGIMIRELAELYRHHSKQPRHSKQSLHSKQSRPGVTIAPGLPELPVQYADFAAWQRRWLESGELERHLAFWQDQLAGRPPALDLPTDRPRPARLTFRGARRRKTLPRRDLEPIRELGHKRGSTLFLALLAAFKVLLFRYTRQRDLWVGVPNANRNRAEIENLIGFFLNMVVIRTDLSERPSFTALLERVTAGFVESLPHQEAPFEKVVERLKPPRDPSRSPLFQVQFSLQNTPGETLELPGLALQRLEIHNRTTKFDLTVFLFDEPEGLVTVLEYNADLFDAVSMERWLSHWQTLLRGVAAAPESDLGRLPLLSEPELAQLRREWNDPRRSSPAETCLHRLFEARVDEAPDAVAVIHEVEELSYRELDERANRLAHRLRRLGVGPEARVGLLLEPGLDLAVAILAVLKAGGAYVPLDPSHPPARLAFMVEDALLSAGRALLVTESRLEEPLVEAFKAALEAAAVEAEVLFVRLDAEREELARESSRRPEAEVEEGHLAYVIYTSGSTGRPKGVAIPHANVTRLLATTFSRFRFSREDVWTLFHSHAFDFSVWEIWGALAHGGSLVVVSREIARAPSAFLDLLSTERVSVLNQTPSAFRQLVAAETEDVPRPLALRWVIFGGEALDLASLGDWMSRHGDTAPELVNMYGITETTVHATHRRVRRRDLEDSARSPIGVALANLTIHLFDPEMRLRPIGVPGEIHVGGPGLARGYLARPALTAQRFVADPSAREEGARLYKSGDLARRRPDGELEYLGRIDHQVQIRGYRIELGEIEAALGQYPGARRVVVTARSSDSGEDDLVAYLAASGELSTSDLRRHLASRLPDYMIPRIFVTLKELPLTATGKLDRRALPEPGTHRPQLQRALIAPRTPTQGRLAEIWREVLSLEEVGVDDDFFELGGHSLLATRVISRIREAFGVEIRLHELFEAPTIAGLAARLDGREREDEATERKSPVMSMGSLEGDLPLSYSQERLFLLSQMRGGKSAAFNLFAPLQLRGRLSLPALEASFEEIIRRHAALRTVFAMAGGRPVQRVLPLAPPGLVAPKPVFPAWKLPVVDLRSLPEPRREATARRLAREEAYRPFDVGTGPLFRAFAVRLGEEEHWLLLDMHHIVSDGWSMGVMVEELNALYRAFASGLPSPLAPLSLQYADFARWQREWLQGAVEEEQTTYWRERFADGGRALDLPTDRPRPPVKGFRGRHHLRRLTPGTIRRLEEACASVGATRFMLTLTTLAVLLRSYSGQDDITIGTFIANRNRAETESLIGFFVNNLALRVDLGGSPSFIELLERVRDLTLAAFAHQDLPFEKLLAELDLERAPDRTPLFQVMLVLQNAPMPALDLPEVESRLLDQDRGRANFDLTLWLEDLDATLEYDRDLFEATTAQRVLAHFESLLDDAGGDPSRPIEALSPLAPAERHQLLRSFNDTLLDVADASRGELSMDVATRVSRVARARPASIAVRSAAGESLTYEELEARSARLSRHLRRLGAGPEQVVGLFVERSIEMIVGLFGILRSGAAYLPLDPLHPRERLSRLLEETPVTAVLVQKSLLDRWPDLELPVLFLDDVSSWSEPESRDQDDAEDLPPADPKQLAYLIYTSGSTGRPKAVMIPHGALASYTEVAIRQYRLSSSDRVLQLASITFDASAEEIFPTLCAGATLVLRDEESVGSGTAFVDFCRRRELTVLDLPTAFWQETAGDLLADLPPRLRLVIIGGEKALAERVRSWVDADSPALFNTYGPTEATIVATAWRARPSSSAPIGRPVGNVRAHVVDRSLRVSPLGARGELALGGLGLARGYWRRPGASAEHFVPDPFSSLDGERLYLTGDLARHLPFSGELDFQGRNDHQVKVRGYRVELGEIEAALAEHPTLRESVVIAEPMAGGGGHRLVAYAVGHEKESAARELRDFLAARLPRYMIPAVFVVLDEIPRTATGKLDRRALPRAEAETAEPSRRAPRGEVEETLVAVWSEVLQIETVGVHENFFALGGDSILGIRVVRRAQEAGLELAPLDLFHFQTIAELAPRLEPRKLSRKAGGSFSLTPLQLSHLETGSPLPSRTIVLECQGFVEPSLVTDSLAVLASRHDALRLSFTRSSSGWRQEIGRGDDPVRPGVRLHRIDFSALSESHQAIARERVATALSSGLDPRRGVVSRVAHLDLGAAPARLHWSLHPLVADEHSKLLLTEELEDVYESLARGGKPSLLSGSPSFEQGAELLGEASFSPLPEARLARTMVVELDAERSRSLLDEAPRVYPVEIDEIIACAVTKSFAEQTGKTTLRFELEPSARAEMSKKADFSRTIGPLSRRISKTIDLSEAWGAEEELAVVKKEMRKASTSSAGGEAAEIFLASFEPLAAGSGRELARFLPAAAPLAPLRVRFPSVVGERVQDQLRIHWHFPEGAQDEEARRSLVASFQAALEELIEHCLSGNGGAYAPEDFPEANLSQEDLDKLFTQI